MPFYPFLGEGSPTSIDYRKKGTLILRPLLEDLGGDWDVHRGYGVLTHSHVKMYG